MRRKIKAAPSRSDVIEQEGSRLKEVQRQLRREFYARRGQKPPEERKP